MPTSEDTSTEPKPPGILLKGKSPQALMEEIKQAIWQRRPILGEIMKKHGGRTIFEYTKDFLDINKTSELDSRKPELIKVAGQLTTQRLGQQVGASLSQQLGAMPLVSTADHHSPINHPFWVNSNIISAIPYTGIDNPALKNLIAFSFASVSVNNASGYSRGTEFHGGLPERGRNDYIRLPILPDRLKMGVVYGMRAFTRDDLSKAENELMKREKAGEVAEGRGDRIRGILEKYYASKEVLESPDLSTQITKINYRIWPDLFKPSRKKIPDLLYIEIETIVTELLLKHHFTDTSSLIYRLIFDPQMRKLSLKHFNNLAGGFSLEKNWGTYLFWGVDEKFHRVRLELNSTALYSQDHDYSFPLTPEALREALVSKKIFPSMLLCYLMVALYYGMKCLGGFCQVHDLTVIKRAWGEFLREIGETKEADAIAPVQTKELGGDGMVLVYIKTPAGDFVPATGMDMLLDDLDTRFENYIELSKHVTLSDMMKPLLPEMYTVLYPSHQRDPRLLELNAEMILKATGLPQKFV